MKPEIKVEWHEIEIGSGGLQYYHGKPVVDVKELPNGGYEMFYCDLNENPLPDSPKIICGPPPFME